MKTYKIYYMNKTLFNIIASSKWHAVELAMTKTDWKLDRKKFTTKLAYV